MRDAAILFAVPVEREEFLVRAAESDWLRKFYDPDLDDAQRIGQLEEVWQREYGPLVAEPIGKLIVTARSLNCAVRTGATLSTLRRATAEYRLVILFAHWKGFELVNDDFVPPIDKAVFLRRLDGCTVSLAQWLHDELERVDRRRAPGLGGVSAWFVRRARKRTVCDVLREALSVDPPMSKLDSIDERAVEVLEHETTRAAQRRDALDAWFSGLIRPGNRLELYDGMHDKHTVEAAIDPSFNGILDLTTCSSTILADYIAVRRGLRVRTIQFPQTVELIWEAMSVKTALDFAATGLPYLEARSMASAALAQGVMKAQQPRETQTK